MVLMKTTCGTLTIYISMILKAWVSLHIKSVLDGTKFSDYFGFSSISYQYQGAITSHRYKKRVQQFKAEKALTQIVEYSFREKKPFSISTLYTYSIDDTNITTLLFIFHTMLNRLCCFQLEHRNRHWTYGIHNALHYKRIKLQTEHISCKLPAAVVSNQSRNLEQKDFLFFLLYNTLSWNGTIHTV